MSQDVVFDENIFPFSQLRPNAEAKLHSEILLLPSSLIPSGSVNNLDNLGAVNFPNPASKNHGIFDDVQVAGLPSAEHEEDCCTSPCSDPKAAIIRCPAPHVAALSASELPRADTPGYDVVAPRVDESPRPASAAPEQLVSTDPKLDSPVPVLGRSGSSVHPTGVVSPTPSVADRGHIEQISDSSQQSLVQQQQRPRTRLSEGIRKPHVYKDGTIHYGMLTTSGEPTNLEDALSDGNWKQAMDTEFNALMKNETWHLVPPQRNKRHWMQTGL
jgi:hypothetical protein